MRYLDYEPTGCIYLIEETTQDFDPISGKPIELVYCSHTEVLKVNPFCPCRFRSCSTGDMDIETLCLLPN
jgi:hypothetical protein